MRKTILALAALAATLATPALSQSARGYPPDDSSRGDTFREGRESRDGWREERGGGRGEYGGGREERGRGFERGAWQDQDRPGRGSSFMLRNGNATLAMRCGNEPMQACVDAALKLMDRARAMPATPPNAPVPQ